MKARVWGTAALALALALALAACGQTDEATTKPLPPVETADDLVDEPTISFASNLEAAMAGERQASFPILGQREIVAAIPVTPRSDVKLVELTIYAPSGALFRTFWRGFAADADAPASVPHPTADGDVPVVPVVGEGEAARVFVTIPVEGTHITRFRLAGTFRAEARLGASDAAPYARGGFVIALPQAMVQP